MLHLWMNSPDSGWVEVESYPQETRLDSVTKEAQIDWADRFGAPVFIFEYEGHQTIEEGQFVTSIEPQPLQLALIGHPVVINYLGDGHEG